LIAVDDRLAAVGRGRQDLDHLEEAGPLEVGGLGLLERGQLGLEEGCGFLEVDEGPGAEPVIAGDLGERGGV
jgi:hypothetical protein